MSIQISNITKTFGAFTALKNVSLTINNGELMALLGPSGCGKTTLLRIIAGLESADPGSGPVLFHDDDVSTQSVRQRRVGFVFQHYSLFRHMNIFDNIAFGLKVRPRKDRPGKAEIKERVHALLKLVQLERHAGMYPSQLSGGQRQRVALARSLAVEPKILLLDEPSSALDPHGRIEMARLLTDLKHKGTAILLSSHILSDLEKICDRVGILSGGRLVLEGRLDRILLDNASPGYEITPELPLSREEETKLASLPFVAAVTVDADRTSVLLQVADPSRHMGGLLRFLADSGMAVAGVRLRRASLEDVFDKVADTG